MSELRIEAANATLGALVTGVDLARLDDGDWSMIEAAFHEHALLVFPGQHLAETAQSPKPLRWTRHALLGMPAR